MPSTSKETKGIDLTFEQIYDQYINLVFSRCLYLLQNQTLAEEATQDTMVKVYFALPKFEGRSSLKTWIYRITSNHCFGILKKRKEVSYDALLETGIQFEDGDNFYITIENQSQVTNILRTLPKDIRALLMLKYVDEYSYEEIANITGLSESAIKMRIHRAKETIKALKESNNV